MGGHAGSTGTVADGMTAVEASIYASKPMVKVLERDMVIPGRITHRIEITIETKEETVTTLMMTISAGIAMTAEGD